MAVPSPQPLLPPAPRRPPSHHARLPARHHASPAPAGVLIALIFPGLLAAKTEQGLTEGDAAARSRRCERQGAGLGCRGRRAPPQPLPPAAPADVPLLCPRPTPPPPCSVGGAFLVLAGVVIGLGGLTRLLFYRSKLDD